MIEYLAKGGILVVPILLCSVVALAVFCERLYFFTHHKISGNGLVEKIVALLAAGKNEDALQLVHNDKTPMGRILAHGMDVREQDRETLETVIVHATEEEIRSLSARLQLLATIGNIAPLLGLLGTVLGMIKAFMVIQEMGEK